MKTIRVVGLVVTLTMVGAIAALAVEADRLDAEVGDAIQSFQASSHKVGRFFTSAYGYAVFPSVDKGAVGIGAAEGRGEVYENGTLVGRAKLTQVTVGAQLGGQSYSEVIFFENPRALDEFREGKTAMSAGLSAVAAADGAAAEAKYQHGVLVFTMNRSGLMFEASIGGQHFSFTPMTTAAPAPPAVQSAPEGTAVPPSATPPPAPSDMRAEPPPAQ